MGGCAPCQQAAGGCSGCVLALHTRRLPAPPHSKVPGLHFAAMPCHGMLCHPCSPQLGATTVAQLRKVLPTLAAEVADDLYAEESLYRWSFRFCLTVSGCCHLCCCWHVCFCLCPAVQQLSSAGSTAEECAVCEAALLCHAWPAPRLPAAVLLNASQTMFLNAAGAGPEDH